MSLTVLAGALQSAGLRLPSQVHCAHWMPAFAFWLIRNGYVIRYRDNGIAYTKEIQ